MKYRLHSVLMIVCSVFPLFFGDAREPRSFSHDEVSYVALAHLAAFYGFGRIREENDDFRMGDDRILLIFTRDSRRMDVNGVNVWLHNPVRQIRRRWVVTEADVHAIIDPLLRTERQLESAGYRRVVLDPGHGGDDRGATGASGLLEKDLTLDIARRARSILVHAGVQVLMTRELDRTISLADRVQKTREWEADVFVSIHLNHAANPSAAGTETFVLSGAGQASTASGNPGNDIPDYPGNQFDGANAILGYTIQRRVLESTSNVDRGVRRARFAVLRDAPCPAVLVECAFLSNEPEEARLATEIYRDEIARGIAGGILDYIATVQRARSEVP